MTANGEAKAHHCLDLSGFNSQPVRRPTSGPCAMESQRGMPLICALDQGTTSTRAILYEAATMRPVAAHQMEHAQHMPQAGCGTRAPVARAPG